MPGIGVGVGGGGWRDKTRQDTDRERATIQRGEETVVEAVKQCKGTHVKVSSKLLTL